ncbi:PQQ-dependent oxidoreductase, gdhB family [plant metagenome]|uniref:PQQ-dependent oxidoreductase, gdhB family n=1 Tax=plant metagenome TaxID=1297885 RepID=A0A484R7I4_9ZZZZ
MQIALRFFSLIVASVASGIVGSIIQTQINLMELSQIGAMVSLPVRLSVSLEDLTRFGPLMAVISLCALLPAMTIGQGILAKLLPTQPRLMYAIFGLIGMFIAFRVMSMVLPLTNFVSATRNGTNLLIVCLAGAVGGYVYAYLMRSDTGRKAGFGYAAAAVLLSCIMAFSFAITSPQPEPAIGKTDPRSYSIQTLAEGLNRPWSIGFLPDGQALVTEMGGRIFRVNQTGDAVQLDTAALPPFFKEGGVSGLLEVAVDPDFPSSQHIFLSAGYGVHEDNGTQLIRARLENDRIVDAKVLYQSTRKSNSGNHGGRITFLPDKTILLTVGDGIDTREESQKLDSSLGKVIRVDRNGAPPTDNPFMGREDVKPEIYSFGHRNAQGIASDKQTGIVYLSEHGPRGGDEINIVVPGENYGWPLVTGSIDYSYARVTPFQDSKQFVAPIHVWTPSIAPSGIDVYRGSLFEAWDGDLLVPSLRGQSVRRISHRNGEVQHEEILLAELGERIRDVKVSADGSIYVLTDGLAGRLLRLTPSLPEH